MFGWDDAIGAGMGVIGGLAKLFGGDPRQKYYDAAMKQYQSVDPNSIQARDIGGIQGTAFNKIDPTSRNAMMGALQGLQAKYAQGGLDAIDRGKMAMLQAGQAAGSKRAQDAVLQNARATGTLNSGRALAGQLIAGQGQQSDAAMQAVQQGAEAEQARMGALKGIVGTAGALQQGDFTVANANDALSRFNKGLEVGNADRQLAAGEDRVKYGLAKGKGIGDIGGQAQPGNAVQDFAGGMAQLGSGAAKKIMGDNKTDIFTGEREVKSQPTQTEQSAAWNWPDLRY